MPKLGEYSRRVILFGAGASYGSGSVIPQPPPLGNDLFNILASTFPATWGALPRRISEKFTNRGFEAGMAALLATGSHEVAPMMQQFAVAFSRYELGSPNAYVSLMESLDQAGKLSGTAFATLNYECLLEWALITRGRRGECGDVLPGPRGTFIWKLHGSCNFVLRSDQLYVAPASTGVTFSPQPNFDADLEVIDPRSVADRMRNTGLYPAMAYYAPGKKVQMSARSIRLIQEFYARAVLAAESVAIIGVRPNIADYHVWGPLAATPARILFVGSKDSYNDWRNAHRVGRRTKYLGKSFSSSVAKLVSEL